MLNMSTLCACSGWGGGGTCLGGFLSAWCLPNTLKALESLTVSRKSPWWRRQGFSVQRATPGGPSPRQSISPSVPGVRPGCWCPDCVSPAEAAQPGHSEKML